MKLLKGRKLLAGGFFVLLTLATSAQDSEKLAVANNGFAFDLLKQIAKEQPGQNIFISPFSVSTALQMVCDGAAGETKTEMQRVLKTDALPTEKLNAAYKELNESLKSQTNVILDLADSIWYQKGFQLKPDFIADNQNFFQAELAAVDFAKPESADVINNWAEKITSGKIKGVVSFPFQPLTKVILANAIYFKGKWAEPFDISQTKPREFYLSNGSIEQAPMMSERKKFSYQESADFQAVELPYAGNRLEMYLFLPATNSSPQKLLAKFDGKDWQDNVLDKFSDREGFLAFPKFKLDYDIILNNSLLALGMHQAFSDNANFSAMANEPLFISQVKQKSFVAIDEAGTEAAAVTTVTMEGMAVEMNRPKPFEMIVNRPFFFVIADSKTQTILFTGIVENPTP